MRRAVALAATVAAFGALVLTGCQGREGVGDRTGRDVQISGSSEATEPSSTGGGGAGTDGQQTVDVSAVESELDAIDALLSDADGQLAEDGRAPEDTD